jgi:TRAP-type C4-dicarboxylate transport system substrate-binding protein
MDAAVESRDFERKFINDNEKQAVEDLKKGGMEVNEPDKTVFQKATEPVYKKFEGEIGKDLIDKILKAQ